MARSRSYASGKGSTQQGGGNEAPALAFMNRTMTIMRGVEINSHGDESDVGVPYLTGVPAALAEESSVTFDRASETRRTIRTITLVFQAWVDVTTDDTLMDEATSYYYLIDAIKQRPGIGYYPAQQILTLRMRSGITARSDD